MHSALFVVSIPSDKRKWNELLAYIEAKKIGKSESVQRLAPNVWLIDVQESFAPLAHLVAIAEQQQETYGILPFEDVPKWLPGSFHPKAIQSLLSP